MSRVFCAGAAARGRRLLVGSCAAASALLLFPGGGSSGRGAPASLADVVRRVDSGLMRVETRGCGRALSGTGFLVDSRHVATAEHVVDGALRIGLMRGGRLVGRGTIVGADAAHDLALVRTDRPIAGHVFSLSRRRPRMSEDVAALGFPLGRPLTVARGFVRGTARTVPAGGAAGQPLIQTDAAVNHGDSGAPLVSVSDGAVLGMVNLSSARAGGPSFAVSARVAEPLFAGWRSDPEAVPQRPCRHAGGPLG